MDLKHRTLWTRLRGRKLWVFLFVYGRLDDDDSRPEVTASVGAAGTKKLIRCPMWTRRPRTVRELLSCFQLVKLALPETASEINHPVRFWLEYPTRRVALSLCYYDKRAERNRKLYYVPFGARFQGDHAEHLRRTSQSTLVFVRRPKYKIEESVRFRVRESKLVTFALYVVSSLTASPNGPVVFYEKFASKADEGAFELFAEFQKRHAQSYFVIDRGSSDFARVQAHRNVVRKFSWKYYWVLFRAIAFVGTEVPTHLSLLRSNNSWMRRRIYTRPYVFLQHGIIYMKNLGRTSIFVKDREGEPAFIVASSEKERAVIERDLLVPADRILVTGLGQFSLIERDSIEPHSPDVLTIMLTWRLEDEAAVDFERTTYVRALRQAVEAVEAVSPSATVRLLPHPKVAEQLKRTELGSRLWNGTVSSALEDTKLLITDYSSACYNSFYRGSGVVFYQPDLDTYEQRTGPLIPDPDEYIGLRAFDSGELTQILGEGMTAEGEIDLSRFRTPEHVRRYSLINEFSDGRNLERISSELVRIFGGNDTSLRVGG